MNIGPCGTLLVLSSLALAASAESAPPVDLTTHAARTRYTETGRYAEVLALCQAFPKAYPARARCERFGTSPQGRPLVALVLSADGALTPEAATRKARPVLLLQGGIHAGEIDGKDAGFALTLALLEGRAAPGALARVTLVFVPVLNVDGHERFGEWNRPNQVGPKAMGWRVTAQNLNLNRDFVKAEAPETVALLGLLGRWDPVLFADLHVTDGAKFQHDVAVTLEPRKQGPPGLQALGRRLQAELFSELEAQGHSPLDFYPSFLVDDEPTSGVAAGWPPPRFAHAYWAARNRFGVLVEAHSWKPYAQRVQATLDVCSGLLRLAARDGVAWQAAARAADAADVAGLGDQVTLAWTHGKASRPLSFLGYAYSQAVSEVSGKVWIQYDEAQPRTLSIPSYDELVAQTVVAPPRGGYLVPREYEALVLAKLAAHRLTHARTAAPHLGVEVQRFRAESPVFRGQPYEGRLTVTASGAWRTERRDVATGTLFVPVNQPHGALAVHLFEPSGPDSLFQWGYFNSHLEQKEYLEDYVTETIARQQLLKSEVRVAFEAKLKDPDFEKSPAARLRFFYERHPSFDSELNVLPIWRTDELRW